ncbi:MAG: nucleoside 2-deoxyribosyltransferase [Oscillospiraceae bacterium]|nr:nucleoside 2-deoxyribosyltransferase [Oscillospiraceae bacterium]
MKKIISILLVLALSLAACANTAQPAAEEPAEQVVENAGNGKRVYFAGPLFNQSEKDYNLKMAQILEEYGYEVFLPQRDGIEAAQLEGKSEEELIEMIFSLDASEVEKADIVFMNLDGRVPDEGACVELGIAYAQGKRCYGFKTDTRSVELGLELNPMISGCMIKVFTDYDGDKMIESIRQYLSENEL